MHFSRSPFIALAVTATIGKLAAARELADLLHRRDAVHLRHHDVHQDDVDLGVRLDEADRLAAGFGRDDRHAFVVENGREGEDVAHVVVDDQRLLALQRAVGAVEGLDRRALVLGHQRRGCDAAGTTRAPGSPRESRPATGRRPGAAAARAPIARLPRRRAGRSAAGRLGPGAPSPRRRPPGRSRRSPRRRPGSRHRRARRGAASASSATTARTSPSRAPSKLLRSCVRRQGDDEHCGTAVRNSDGARRWQSRPRPSTAAAWR